MISIVIPNYNSGELLNNNLPRLFDLLKKSKLKYEIIVSDDASTDNSREILKSLPVTLVTHPENTGFGACVDRGIRSAGGEIIFVLNAIDILPEKSDYFSIMLKHFDNPKVFSVAAVKRDNESHGSGEIYFYHGLYMHRRGQQGKETAWADGGAQALRREYYFKIGGFDPIYKLYWEDVDLGFRAWKAGYIIDYEPKALLLHKKDEGPIAKKYSKKDRRILNIRNQYLFTWKHSDLKQKLWHCLWTPYHFAVAIKNKDSDWFVAYLKAIYEEIF